jgi:hypothetical protein
MLTVAAAESGYELRGSALDMAGGCVSGGAYRCYIAVGQSCPTGSSESGDYSNKGGFIYDLQADLSAPVIDHSPETEATAGGPLVVEADIRDEGSGIMVCDLHYRRGGEAEFGSVVSMTRASGDTYAATIPGAAVAERGLEYYIRAIDGAGNRDSTDAYMVIVNVTQLQIDQELESRTYRLISFPITTTSEDPGNVLVDDLGSPDRKRWKLCHWSPTDAEYHEYDVDWSVTTDNIAPGRGYWLITRDNSWITVSGSSVDFSEEYVVTLYPGWNQIGCPYAFSVDWQDVTKAQGIEDRLVAYLDGGYEDATTLDPWEGYWVKNNSLNPAAIAIPPIEAIGPSQTPAKLSTEPIWQVQLSVRCGEYHDAQNYLGISDSALPGWDAQDYSEPPPPFTFVSLYFVHEDRDYRPGKFATDFRCPFEEGETWDFTVESNVSETAVDLDVVGARSIPDSLVVAIFDLATNASFNPRENGHYQFSTGIPLYERAFRFAVGSEAYVEEVRNALPVLPDHYALGQNYPNPFRHNTEIRFELAYCEEPSVQHVWLGIYNAAGRLVRTLVDQYHEPGRYVVPWDGLDASGRASSDGLYFYRLTADNGRWSQTRKMVRIR